MSHNAIVFDSQAVAVFIWLEMAFPHSLVPGLGRVAAVLLLGCWFNTIAGIAYVEPIAPEWQVRRLASPRRWS